MQKYEYKVVPAPAKGLKAKGVKSPEARFANALETLMNSMGEDGWDYQRADILPSEERVGLRGSQTVYRSMLVFRRAQPDQLVEEAPAAVAATATEADDTAPPDTHDDSINLWAEDPAPEDMSQDDTPREDPPLTRA